MVRSGRVRSLGASSLFAWRLVQMQQAAEKCNGASFISMQNHYNLIYREEEREMIPCCHQLGVGLMPWSPLARGVLAGNKNLAGEKLTTRSKSDPFTDRLYTRPTDFDVVDAVTEIAKARAVSNAQVALAWLLSKPGVSAPIVGATKAKHLEDALRSVTLSLSSAEIARLEAPYTPHPVAGLQVPRLTGPKG